MHYLLYNQHQNNIVFITPKGKLCNTPLSDSDSITFYNSNYCHARIFNKIKYDQG